MLSVRGAEEHTLSSRVWNEPSRIVGVDDPRRPPFARDRERIVQSRAFRRLAGKTQVFTSRESDHFRSRLTHTIEVAQIAREVARALGLNEELVEALALVHDIGHPPFGHAGERALDTCLKEHGLRFDHNLHALRIVEHFEDWYAAHRGLNLSLGVREGIVKHSRDYSASDHPLLSPYFLDQRPPLEAQLIDLADEIAYLTADLDDGVESGLLEIDHICANITIMGRAYQQVEHDHPGIEPKFLFHEALQVMQAELTADLITNTVRNVREHNLRSLAEVRACPHRVATFSPEYETQRREEKAYLYRVLYTCDFLEAEHHKAENVVTTLFHHFMRSPELLPSGYVEESATDGLPRVIADYIAGMTDNYILQQFWIASKLRR
ncbi:deoxyguanosinetriphosphate triphosphohydrolase family protein [Terriglobus roseus]|uniref:Deoxyguanosinetriphosphate triphosphohydrolase-like protein n=1 Tax=Terriglobus roseus TaxID=392734 RepID=A0A1H4RJ02_9BACT|nr:dNTP triphosphohydrolase [Terriglobus roseus]SEC31880.1 dGTPase [Terriglobus roseus]